MPASTLVGMNPSRSRNPSIAQRHTAAVKRHYIRRHHGTHTHRRGTSRNKLVIVQLEGDTNADAVAAQPTAASGTR